MRRNKLSRANAIVSDLLSQIQDNFFVKCEFFISFYLHYFLKALGITFTKFPTLNVKMDGVNYRTRKNTIDFWVVWKRYENDITEFLRDLPDNKGVFIDVGAHIGRFSALMGVKNWDVYSFEPMSTTYNQLITNMGFNNISANFHGFNYGLGNAPSSQTIYFSGYKTGEASFTHSEGTSSEETVKIDTFENLVKDSFVGRDVVLKIDVEGFEHQVIEGMKNTIQEVKPLMILELWKENSENITQFLYSLGYVNHVLYWFPPDSPHKEYFRKKYGWKI